VETLGKFSVVIPATAFVVLLVVVPAIAQGAEEKSFLLRVGRLWLDKTEDQMRIRKVKAVLAGKDTMDGAGVRLKRIFGYPEVPSFDPFLLLDDFRSDNAKDYIAGFPWHPHRGIETVTYLIEGRMKHGDNLGNKGVLKSGGIQWMTAGSGIIHEEMPEQVGGVLAGLQLWVNLPRSHKMMNPRYQDIAAVDVPVEDLPVGGIVRVLAGSYGDQVGPIRDVVAEPSYLDVTLPSGSTFVHEVQIGHTVCAYLLMGSGVFSPGADETLAQHVVLYADGQQVSIQAGPEGVRFILVSGQPLGEPVAWQGPIVMTTQEELEIAFREYRAGTFLKPTSDK
jgi:quercetin 2,3-dioxygenase